MTWNLVPLANLLVRSEDAVDIVPTESYSEVTVRLWGKGVVLRGEVQGQEMGATRRFRVRAGQFILSRIDARNGALGIVPAALDRAVVSNDFPTYNVVQDRLLVPFLGWLSRTKHFVDLCLAASEGTTNRVRLKEDRFLATTIPLPPLSEQRRIVAKVEELAAKIDEARGLRNGAFQEASSFMAAACEPLLDARTWQWRTVADIVGAGNLRNGKSVKPVSYETGVRCLRLSALQNNEINCQDSKPVALSETEAEPYWVNPGDVYVIRGNGSKHLVGRAGYVQQVDSSTHGTIFPDLFIRIPLPRESIIPEFFIAFWNSRRMRNIIEDASKTTSGIWKINQGHVESFSIPVPPLPEQRRMVAYLDDLQAKVDSLKTLQAQSAAEIDALLPSVLDKAFKGEL